MAKSNNAKPAPDFCPCGSGAGFQQCCAPYLAGRMVAPDAQALMRSRYTAYTLDDEDYLQKTWHPRSRPALVLERREPCQWLALKVLAHHEQDANATVEFIARYKINGRAQRLHEVSRFEREDGQWLYVDGDFPELNQETTT